MAGVSEVNEKREAEGEKLGQIYTCFIHCVLLVVFAASGAHKVFKCIANIWKTS